MGISYFFLYPAGQIGLMPVTFLVSFPLMQVIVDFLAALTFAFEIAAERATSKAAISLR